MFPRYYIHNDSQVHYIVLPVSNYFSNILHFLLEDILPVSVPFRFNIHCIDQTEWSLLIFSAGGLEIDLHVGWPWTYRKVRTRSNRILPGQPTWPIKYYFINVYSKWIKTSATRSISGMRSYNIRTNWVIRASHTYIVC